MASPSSPPPTSPPAMANMARRTPSLTWFCGTSQPPGQTSSTSIACPSPTPLGSDHAAMVFSWAPALYIPPAPSDPTPRWVVHDSMEDVWKGRLAEIVPTTVIHTDPHDVASTLLQTIIDTNDWCFDRARPLPLGRGARWWNEGCSGALHLLRDAPPTDRPHAFQRMRNAIRTAKRDWAESVLAEATNNVDQRGLWAVAKWRKGRTTPIIPPIQFNGGTTPNHADMSTAFRERFFPPTTAHVDPTQSDDPDPIPPREWDPITEDEVRRCLAGTSNSSTPGLSGVSYKFIKWAFASRPQVFTHLFNLCLTQGAHPWKEAKVVVIPKPSRPDYSAPKAYRPIALLECLGKLLEKVVARRIMDDSNHFGLIDQHQLGSRDYHCAVDAALCVVHNIEACRLARRAGALLLFDISGFFDNIHTGRALHLLSLMGFPPEVVQWTSSFLAPRNTRLAFNNSSSSPFPVGSGTPQGSPLSPILSATYTSAMIRHLNSTWTDKTVQLYVDDGAIFASGVTARSALRTAAVGLEEVTAWLGRQGLKTDADKAEAMVFLPPRPNLSLLGTTPTHVAYRDPFAGHISIRISQRVRYLGLFLDPKLSWKPHVETLAARGRSTIRSLSLLGNSVRGLRFAAWRRLFQAIVIPILTYGIAAWHPLHGTKKGLISILQVAQNDALRKMSGCFRTTPIDPLHNLMAIPPIDFTARKLVRSYADRLSRLPPFHLVHTVTTHNPALSAIGPIHPSTTLTHLHSFSQTREFTFPPRARNRRITHDHITFPSFPLSSRSHATTRKCLTRKAAACPVLIVYSVRTTVEGFISAWVLQSDLPHIGGLALHSTAEGSLASALLAGIQDRTFQSNTGNYSRVDILIPSRQVINHVRELGDHPLLGIYARVRSFVPAFLGLPHSPSLGLHWFAPHWPHARHLRHVVGCFDDDDLPLRTPPVPVDRRQEMYDEWEATYIPSSRSSHTACHRPNGNRPPPFIRGALSRGNRRLFSAAVQVATGHCFSSTYSIRFRPSAGDPTTCPCTHLLISSIPRLDSPPISPSSTQHSVAHVLLGCPRHTSARLEAFGPPSTHSLRAILSTFAGGFALCGFLWSTQDLLFPLDAPDPNFRSPPM
jgi:hypothetical protein